MQNTHKMTEIISSGPPVRIILMLVVALVSCREVPHSDAPKQHPIFLFRISMANRANYILGSIHAASKKLYPLAPEMYTHFNESEVLVLEADISKANEQSIMHYALEKGTIHDPSESLNTWLPISISKELDKALQGYGLKSSDYQKFKPWLVALTVGRMQLRSSGFDPKYGIDFHFLQRAQKLHKEILGLETIEYQINLLSSLSRREQSLFLTSMLEDPSRQAGELDEIQRLWIQGNVKKLQSIIHRMYREQPELHPIYQKLLLNRNIHMVRKILSFFPQARQFFIIVGAGHLVGEEGILDLLRKSGVKVEQMYGTITNKK